ncbi:MAG: ECF transporter S component [Candidatus Metalachnospira sp.]|nr:ECF transporter S component [Candidatus Metalachnospira sp.]
MERSDKVRKLTTMGMMAAVSIILVYLIHFPIFPAAAFLEYDPADIPIYICTFLYGPLSGFILTVIVAFIQGFTVSAQSGIIGVMMHIFATGFFAIVAGNIYKRNHSKKTAVKALFAGSIVMIVMMCVWNIIFTPIFMGVPRSAVMPMILPIIAPFNAVKAGVNSLVTFLIYKKIANHIPHGKQIKD